MEVELDQWQFLNKYISITQIMTDNYLQLKMVFYQVMQYLLAMVLELSVGISFWFSVIMKIDANGILLMMIIEM